MQDNKDYIEKIEGAERRFVQKMYTIKPEQKEKTVKKNQ